MRNLGSGPTIVDDGTAFITGGDIANKLVCWHPVTDLSTSAPSLENLNEITDTTWTNVHKTQRYPKCSEILDRHRVKRNVITNPGGEWDSNCIPYTIDASLFSK